MACPLSEGGTHEVGGFLVTSKAGQYVNGSATRSVVDSLGSVKQVNTYIEAVVLGKFRSVFGFQVNALEAFRPRGTDAHGASKRADQTAKGLFDPR